MHIQTILELIDYRMNTIDSYHWQCYGEGVKMVDFESESGEIVGSFLFKPQQKEVVEVYVYNEKEAYRWIAPEYREAYLKESEQRGFKSNVFTDELDFTEIMNEEDMLDIATEFMAPGLVRVRLTDEEIQVLERLAQQRNMDFQTLLNEIATDYLTKLVEEKSHVKTEL